jgi:hypothetical protein
MKVLIGALAAVLLAGCAATIGDVRSNTPLLNLDSHKPAKNVAECIRDGWQATPLIGGNLGGLLQTSGDRYTVIAPYVDSPWNVVDIDPSTKGSVVKYHFYRTWQSPPDSVLDVVRSCAK